VSQRVIHLWPAGVPLQGMNARSKSVTITESIASSTAVRGLAHRCGVSRRDRPDRQSRYQPASDLLGHWRVRRHDPTMGQQRDVPDEQAIATAIANAPDAPGCYLFHAADGKVLYVGKAARLRTRLRSYLRPDQPRIERMISEAATVDWRIVDTATDALLLEAALIRRLQPPYNVRLKEPGAYPYLALTRSTKLPARLHQTRRPARSRTRRFGPYPNPGQAQRLADVAQIAWQIRSCPDGTYRDHARRGRPCLLAGINRCCAPCVGAVDEPEHERRVEQVVSLLSGRPGNTRSRLRELMDTASSDLLFEHAAQLRDALAALDDDVQRTAVAAGTLSVDVAGWAGDGIGVCVQLLVVRDGRLVAAPSLVADRALGDTVPSPLAALAGLYAHQDLPTELVLSRPLDIEELADALSCPIVTTPRGGRRRHLADLADTNAADALRRERLRRASDADTRRAELGALAEILGLPAAPLRIECVDISHHRGEGTVAGFSVLEEGVPVPARHRAYRLDDHDGDDYAAIRQAVARRLSKLVDDPSSAPGLLVIDGGPGQLAQAQAAADALGVTVPLAALAKRLEEIWLPAATQPLVLPDRSPALYLLQRARDAAHDTANAASARLRARTRRRDPLEAVPGLGPARRARLIAAAGSRTALAGWDRDRLDECTWLPEAVRDALFDHLHPPAA
jgi:excinuclease ABC subunit C